MEIFLNKVIYGNLAKYSVHGSIKLQQPTGFPWYRCMVGESMSEGLQSRWHAHGQQISRLQAEMLTKPHDDFRQLIQLTLQLLRVPVQLGLLL